MIINCLIKKSILILTILISFNSFAQKIKINNINEPLNIFIDCEFCDKEYFKKEINFVNYVRDTKDADVHILVTSQQAANKGTEYTFFFFGLKKYKYINDTLLYTVNPDNTEDEIRKIQAKIIKIGLLYYISHNQNYNIVEISSAGINNKQIIIDKWKNWVFDINLNGFFKDETSFKNISSRSNISAQKITENIKIELKGYYDFVNKEYIINNREHNTLNRSLHLNWLTVKSINNHWSYGFNIYTGNSTFKNFKSNSNISSAIEYNLFPYSQSTQKQLRFLFFSGYSYYFYNDTTIYNKLQEGFFNENLEIAYETKQKWGNISVAIRSSTYLPDYSKYLLSLKTKSKIRIIKGFSILLNGGVSLIHNQIYIPKGELSAEEILTQQKQQKTNHLIWIKIGLSYTFGSKYNNIVNPRFGK